MNGTILPQMSQGDFGPSERRGHAFRSLSRYGTKMVLSKSVLEVENGHG